MSKDWNSGPRQAWEDDEDTEGASWTSDPSMSDEGQTGPDAESDGFGSYRGWEDDDEQTEGMAWTPEHSFDPKGKTRTLFGGGKANGLWIKIVAVVAAVGILAAAAVLIFVFRPTPRPPVVPTPQTTGQAPGAATPVSTPQPATMPPSSGTQPATMPPSSGTQPATMPPSGGIQPTDLPTGTTAARPSAEDIAQTGCTIEYPNEDEYYDEYRYAIVVAPKGHSIYGYATADHSGRTFTVLNGEVVTMLAERNGWACVIVPSTNTARWVNMAHLVETQTPDQPIGSTGTQPCDADIAQTGCTIEYPNDNEYYDDYRYAVVVAPKGHSIYGYATADHSGRTFTVLNGEVVTVLAERNGWACVIIQSTNTARWVNMAHLESYEP